jgi:rare lipoprotein A (peptidoglycan hydrolase)
MRVPARIAVPLLVAAFAAPAAAAADPPTGGTAAPQPTTAIVAPPHVFVGKVARFTGGFAAREAGRTVTIERFDEDAAAWTAVTTAQVQADGSYAADWRADVTGRHRTRASLAGAAPANPDGGAAAVAAAAGEEASMTVYRRAVASWYGPGFYGRRTACGQRMTRTLLGVAHKRLACGTDVAITYRGRSITVPVVDRGPFVRGRRWDLTAAAAKALRFTFTDRIGAVRIG